MKNKDQVDRHKTYNIGSYIKNKQIFKNLHSKAEIGRMDKNMIKYMLHRRDKHSKQRKKCENKMIDIDI